MLYICISSNKFDLNQAVRVSHTKLLIFYRNRIAHQGPFSQHRICFASYKLE